MQRDARPDVRLNGRNRLKRRKSEDGASKRLWNGWQVRGKEGKEGAAVVDGAHRTNSRKSIDMHGVEHAVGEIED